MAANDKEFQMTREEVEKFEKAMKNEEFRKLLVEYAQEISDPENKKKYEEEIAMMEKERGMDVKFVNPEGGFVVKTTQVKDGLKAFVNVCYNQHIGKATYQQAEKREGGERKKGQQWSIPYSISQPRDDVDKVGKKCVTFDAVFNPDTYNKCQENSQFKKMVIDTALDGVEKQHNVKLDKKNLKFPKMKFKGMKQATVIRSKSKEGSATKNQDEGITVGDKTIPYPYANNTTSTMKHGKTKESNKSENIKITDHSNNNTGPVEPKYNIVHRGVIDFQNFTNARDSCSSTRPKELVVKIELPALKSAASLELDIFEKQLVLSNKKPAYHLDLSLPYPVDEKQGSAKFDKTKQQLVVTLSVQPLPLPPQSDLTAMEVDETPLVEVLEKTQEPQAEGQDVNSDVEDQVINPGDQCTAESCSTIKEPENGDATQLGDQVSEHAQANLHLHEEATEPVSDDRNQADAQSEDKIRKPDKADLSSCSHDGATENVTNTNHIGDNKQTPTRLGDQVKLLDQAELSSHPDTRKSAINESQEKDNAEAEACEMTAEVAPGLVIPGVCAKATEEDFVTVDGEHDVEFDIPDNMAEFSSPFFFKCPSYSYHQDDETVTFIVHVAGVAMDTVSLGFNENKCYISFPACTTSPRHLPDPDYALYIMFKDDHNLAPDLCHIDVAEQNLVLTLQKGDACKGTWDSFRAGPSEEALEEKQFLTENNIQAMLEEIASQDPWVNESKYETDLEVTALSEESLSIKLESKLKPEENAKTTQAGTSKTHVESTKHQNGNQIGNMEPGMETGENLGLDSVEKITSKLQESRLSSSDEGIVSDLSMTEDKSRLLSSTLDADQLPDTNGNIHDSSASQESKVNRSDSVESASSDRSDTDIVANAIRSRKSCLRRSSSCSTDDSLSEEFDFNGPLSPNGTSESPGRKNVRFNLNPNVRVFSNKKDKKRWKMEQRLKAQQKEMRDRENGVSEGSEPIAELEEVVSSGASNRKDSDSSVDEDWTLVDKPTETSLSNNLIFELDD